MARALHRSRTRGFIAFIGLQILFLLAVILAPRVFSLAEGEPPPAEPRVSPAGAAVTPDPVRPPDVLTISLRLENQGGRVEDAVAAVRIVGPNGRVAKELRQENIAVPAEGTQTVYWVWRLPERLPPGTYRVLAGATAGADRDPQLAEPVASFEVADR